MATSSSRVHPLAKYLALFIRDQADWRRAQARRFPDDERNIRSAEGLEELAAYVEQLPDTDRALIQLQELDTFADDDTFIAGANARRLVARYRFESEEETPRDLLRALVAAVVEDRKTRRSPDGTTRKSPAAAKYLQDIFLKIRERDREVSDLGEQIDTTLSWDENDVRMFTRREVVRLSDLIVHHENVVGDLLALVAPAAVRRAEEAALVAPEYQQGIFDLTGVAADLFIRPIFAEAGIADRYITSAELTSEAASTT